MLRRRKNCRSTCSALCDEAARPEATLRQGLLHNLQRHPVLDTASRVQHLRLCQDLQQACQFSVSRDCVQEAICSASQSSTLPLSFSVFTLARICSTGDQKGLLSYMCEEQWAVPLCPKTQY